MKVQTYRDLVAWQKARLLVRAVYEASVSWPRAQVYGLTDQARRSAVSIPANIAEGQDRQGKAEFLHHLSMANGSLHELETHVYIALDLGYLSPTACDALLEQTSEVGRLLNGLMRSLRSSLVVRRLSCVFRAPPPRSYDRPGRRRRIPARCHASTDD